MAQEAQVSGPAELSSEESIILKVIVQCRRDPSPTHCEPFRPLVAHLNQTTIESAGAASISAKPGAFSPPPAPNLPTIQTASAPKKVTSEDLVRLAQGHPAGDLQVIPAPRTATLAFTAATDTKTAAIALTVDRSAANSGVADLLTVKAQTPLADDEDYTKLATQDGLTKASTLGLEWTRLWASMGDESAIQNDPTYQARCVALLHRFAAAAPGSTVPTTLTQPYGCNGSAVWSLIDAAAALPADLRGELLAEARKLSNEVSPPVHSLWMLTTGAEVGFQKHTFYDPATLGKSTLDRTPFELSAALTYVFHGGDMSGTLGYKFQRIYEDGGGDGFTRTACLPGGTPLLTCANGYIGRPVREKQHLISADYRYITANGLFGLPMGFNPTVTYDAESGEHGLQLPIYFMTDKAGGFSGGVRWDWVSEGDESTIGVFVTSTFCVLPGCASAGK
jgi:hypothetical protein